MKHPTQYTCDCCQIIFQEGGIISSVEVIWEGDGAARNKINGIDLCRSCYGKLSLAIKDATSAVQEVEK